MFPKKLFEKKKKWKKESVIAHFAEVNHNGEDDWEVRLTDQTDNVEELTKSFGNTFQPNGLIEREVALFWCLNLTSFFQCWPTISVVTDGSDTYFHRFFWRILPYYFIYFLHLFFIFLFFHNCFSSIYYYYESVDLFSKKGILLMDAF